MLLDPDWKIEELFLSILFLLVAKQMEHWKVSIIGNGDCLFNSVIAGHIAMRNCFPHINEEVFKAQEGLRSKVQQIFREKFQHPKSEDDEFLAAVYDTILDEVKNNKLQGYPKQLREYLLANRSNFIRENVLQKYIESISEDLWGGYAEIVILDHLFQLSFKAEKQPSLCTSSEEGIVCEIRNGNHFNLIISEDASKNTTLLEFLANIGAFILPPTAMKHMTDKNYNETHIVDFIRANALAGENRRITVEIIESAMQQLINMEGEQRIQSQPEVAGIERTLQLNAPQQVARPRQEGSYLYLLF